jgi:tight adherence protein C
MLILFLCFLAIFVIMYFYAKSKYEADISTIDQKEYKLKKYLVVGLLVLHKTGYKYKTIYDIITKLKYSELYGVDDSEYYLKIHLSNILTSIFITFNMLLLFGTFMSNIDSVYFIFVFMSLALVVVGIEVDLNNRIKKRRLTIEIDFPDFISKLALLLNAGMTIRNAWERILIENTKKSFFYQEAHVTYEQIKNGRTEEFAYEDFGKRCRLEEVRRFTSLLVQNLKRGDSQIVLLLQDLSRECWNTRKHSAMRLGEEASTKMMFPLMLMFLVILIIIGFPAILALRGVA